MWCGTLWCGNVAWCGNVVRCGVVMWRGVVMVREAGPKTRVWSVCGPCLVEPGATL